jgi:hypothetical protein
VGQTGHSNSRGLYFSAEKETKIKSELFFHQKILSAGKRIELVSDMMYISER